MVDLRMLTPPPNSHDHPEVIEWMKKYSDAQSDYTGLNRDDSSNFLDEKHKQEPIEQLYENVAHANKELEKWCKHYGISYSGLQFGWILAWRLFSRLTKAIST